MRRRASSPAGTRPGRTGRSAGRPSRCTSKRACVCGGGGGVERGQVGRVFLNMSPGHPSPLTHLTTVTLASSTTMASAGARWSRRRSWGSTGKEGRDVSLPGGGGGEREREREPNQYHKREFSVMGCSKVVVFFFFLFTILTPAPGVLTLYV